MIGKKSQTELIGLAIIIIIIAMGFIFYIRFYEPSTGVKGKQDFMDTKLASNMLSVILRTTDKCQDIEMKNLIQACAEGVSTVLYCDTYRPCDRVRDQIALILQDSLDQWGHQYELTAKKRGGDLFTPLGNVGAGGCPSDRMSETYPIPTDSGPALIRLDICR